MKKLLAVLLLAVSSMSYALEVDSTEVVDIATSAVMPDGTLVTTKGTITGITNPPKGDYRVKITNGKGFKGKSFSKMKCNILPLDEINYADTNAVPLVTVFTVKGELYHALGMYSGSNAYPEQGYATVIVNGKSRVEWNSMNCTIK